MLMELLVQILLRQWLKPQLVISSKLLQRWLLLLQAYKELAYTSASCLSSKQQWNIWWCDQISELVQTFGHSLYVFNLSRLFICLAPLVHDQPFCPFQRFYQLFILPFICFSFRPCLLSFLIIRQLLAFQSMVVLFLIDLSYLSLLL